jgi:beta-lactamase class A
LYAGEDILGSFKDGEKIALSKVAMLMITTSDNTASLWCQAMATGTAINEWLAANGLKIQESTRVLLVVKPIVKFMAGDKLPLEKWLNY